MKLLCKFILGKTLSDLIDYFCTIKNQIISENAELEIVGEHQVGKGDLDVNGIIIYNCSTKRIPKNLTQKFPNLKILYIEYCKLKKIDRDDLREYSKCIELSFYSNEIEYLSADLLTDMKSLQIIDLSNNKIQIIEPNIFDGLTNLKNVDLRGNVIIDKCFEANEKHGTTLEQIKQEIRDKFSLESAAKKLKMEFKPNHSGLFNDIKNFLTQNDDNNFKDFKICVGDEEFKVHKFLLAARSEVLADMIKNNIDAECLHLIDISVETFREVLTFLYTDELSGKGDIDFTHLFAAAEKLKIRKLKKLALEKLIVGVDAENALDMLILSNKHNNEELRQKSFDEIKIILEEENIDEMLAMQPEILKKVLVCKREKDKFDAEMQKLLNKQ